MASSRKKVLKWEIFGFVFLIGVGSLIHFIYEWSGYSPIVAFFSAVNESVWEHLKLGFWSLFIFSLIEHYFLKNSVHNFIIAKGAGLLFLQLFIIVFFYTYTYLLGTEILILDIASYVIGSILCQVISYRILIKPRLKRGWRNLFLLFIIGHGLALMIFTYYPPKLPIFQDQNTKTYGTQWRKEK